METRTERLDRERRLILAAKAGNKAAMQSLIESVRPLIWKLINSYRPGLNSARGIDEHDLEQNAIIYVMNAVEKFDPDKGNYFVTYATHWIRHGIQILLRKSMTYGRQESHSVEDLFTPFDGEIDAFDRLADPNAENPLEKTIQDHDFNESILTALVATHVRERLSNYKSVQKNPSIVSDMVILRWLADDPVSLAELSTKYNLSRTTLSTIERAMKKELAETLRK